jgi:pimeloyl-ACP methyl ester carboxylesterase
MGAWMALLALPALKSRVVSLCLIAPAPDFTERLMWDRFDEAVQAELAATGRWIRPSAYGDGGYPITMDLIRSGRENRVLDAPVGFSGPVRILHGQADADVPWQGSLELADLFTSPDVRLTLVKDGDHRLSRPQDIGLLQQTLEGLLESCACPSAATVPTSA